MGPKKKRLCAEPLPLAGQIPAYAPDFVTAVFIKV